MSDFFERQIAEIKSSRALTLYGAFLSGAYALSFSWWAHSMAYAYLSQGNSGRICWPQIPCVDVAGPPQWFLKFWLVLMLLSAVSASFFLVASYCRAGYVFLLSAVFLKTLFFLQDFRLMGNYHYMPFWAAAAYLFFPSKKALLPLLTVGFYLSAGLLKLNQEWLSGAAIPPSWPFSLGAYLYRAFDGTLWRLGSLWSVLLELIFVILLFSRSAKIRWLVFSQLLLFHAISYFIVGHFYPAVMACMLTIFPLLWREERSFSLKPSALAFLALFALFQAVPWLIGGDSSLTGEGRWYSLNMIDANTDCTTVAMVRSPNSTRDYSRDQSGLFVRAQCDPYVYFFQAKQLCSELKPEEKLDLVLSSRRSSDKAFRVVVDERDFCSKGLNYSSWRANGWIKR